MRQHEPTSLPHLSSPESVLCLSCRETRDRFTPEDPNLATDVESEPPVERNGRVADTDMQKRNLAAIKSRPHQVTHQLRCEPSASGVRVGRDGTQLHVARNADAFSGHGNEPAVFPDADI